MVVSADRDGGRYNDTRSVDSLEDPLEVDLASHLLDEDGSKALGT